MADELCAGSLWRATSTGLIVKVIEAVQTADGLPMVIYQSGRWMADHMPRWTFLCKHEPALVKVIVYRVKL